MIPHTIHPQLTYIAARYSRRLEMQKYAKILEGFGYTITSRWLTQDHHITEDQMHAEHTLAMRFAMDNYHDLTLASLCIVFTEEPRARPSRGGKHVEFGIALALGHQIICIGPYENVFYHHRHVQRYDTFTNFALEALA